jgi:hypothetical protein
MSMTRKHFRAIAEAIAESNIDEESRVTVANKIASAIKGVSGNMDRNKFIDACKLNGAKNA